VIKTLDIAWLAGIVEGEGCFTRVSAAGTNARPSAVIAIAMTDEDVVRRAAAILGGYAVSKTLSPAMLKRRPNPKPVYRVSVSGHRAAAWMMTLYALMGKRRKARIAELLREWVALGPPARNAKRYVGPCAHRQNDIVGRKGYGMCIECYNERRRSRAAAA